MNIVGLTSIFLACALSGEASEACLTSRLTAEGVRPAVAGVQELASPVPVKTGKSIDVELTAAAALVWDETTGTVLYEKHADERRPVASLSKLMAALVVRDLAATSAIVEIPPEVRLAQRLGANVKLPIKDHVAVYDLLSAGLVASANDAMVALAMAVSGSEEAFAATANARALEMGFGETRISNATGLAGGEQHSTARDVMRLFRAAYQDPMLRNMLVSKKGVLRTQEGRVRNYSSTNKLLGTYFPVLAAKTGYTREAGENLVVMTYGDSGQRLGAVVLGSDDRFHDMKVLVEWIWRNYSWS